jgi:hypothetical protein
MVIGPLESFMAESGSASLAESQYPKPEEFEILRKS